MEYVHGPSSSPVPLPVLSLLNSLSTGDHIPSHRDHRLFSTLSGLSLYSEAVVDTSTLSLLAIFSTRSCNAHRPQACLLFFCISSYLGLKASPTHPWHSRKKTEGTILHQLTGLLNWVSRWQVGVAYTGIQALERLNQEDCECEPTLGYLVRACLHICPA